MWVQFLESPPPKIGEGKNKGQNLAQFQQLSNMIANFSGMDQHVENGKSSWSTTTSAMLGENKKVQQSWQTSTLAMHLPLACLVSMPVIFCLLPSSSIVILVFYLFSTGISEQHCVRTECKTVNTVHWFDAFCSVIPANNSTTLISPVQSLAGLNFIPLTVYA